MQSLYVCVHGAKTMNYSVSQFKSILFIVTSQFFFPRPVVAQSFPDNYFWILVLKMLEIKHGKCALKQSEHITSLLFLTLRELTFLTGMNWDPINFLCLPFFVFSISLHFFSLSPATADLAVQPPLHAHICKS